ncbi:MAG: hypothetical protein HC888_00135 [Candidatus Competibacteraceae bacterium]|nr:hypothetical protein [Candidatus Competibacteraceae bacterium]
MAMKKYLKSEAPVVIGDSGNESELYPVGYRYQVGEEIFTVVRRFRDSSVEWRRIRRDDGREEEVTVRTIRDDHNEKENGGRKVIVHEPDKRVPQD